MLKVLNWIFKFIGYVILGVFICAGLAMIVAGFLMLLDVYNVMKAPFNYEGGLYSALMYLCVGIAWFVFVLIITIKYIKHQIRSSKDKF